MYLILIFFLIFLWLSWFYFSNYIFSILIYLFSISSFYIYFFFSKQQAKKYNITEVIIIFSILYVCILWLFLFSIGNLGLWYIIFYLILTILFPLILLLKHRYKLLILETFNSLILLFFCFWIYKNNQSFDKLVSFVDIFLNILTLPFMLNILIWIYNIWDAEPMKDKQKTN